MEEHVGYKAFNRDGTNRYGMKFEEGKTYHTDGDIKSGNDGNGFHLSTHISNIFRYFDDSNILIGKVTGYGKCAPLEGTPFGQYDFDDMYACEYLRVDKFLTREEVMDVILGEKTDEVCKYLICAKPSLGELERIYEKFSNNKKVLNTMLYYHLGYKDLYSNPREIDVGEAIKAKKQH